MNLRPRTSSWWWHAMLVPGVLILLVGGGEPESHAVAPRRHSLEIQGMAFRPAVLELEAGDTVVWTNRDMVPHTATGTSEPAWGTGILSQGESGRFVARARGTAPYFCELHPIMKGKLIIR